MKKKTIASLIAIVVIAAVMMFSGCVEEKTSISPNQTQPEKTGYIDKITGEKEQPDPHVRFGKLGEGLAKYESGSYKYSTTTGELLGQTVNVVVENRGGPGLVEVLFEVSHEKIGKEVVGKKFVYLEADEKREVSTFVNLKEYSKRIGYSPGETIKINVAALPTRIDVNSLIQDLKREKPEVRKEAAVILGEVKDKKAVDPLIQALKDEDSGVRKSAAEALGKIGDARAVDPLIQALKDESGSVRKSAAEALGKIGDARAVDPLIQALKDESEYVRMVAAKALAMIGEPAVDPLIQALKDESWSVRESAAEALGEIGDARAVDPLIQALKDESGYVRTSATEALGKIGDARAIDSLYLYSYPIS